MLQSDVKDFILKRRFLGKRGCFQWDDVGLTDYINWSFSRNCLFYALGGNGLSGVGVAYPMPKAFDGNIENLLPYDEQLEAEDSKELVIMDWIADNKEARSALVKQFFARFPNWSNQKKWGVHYGKPKVFSNEYIIKLATY